MLIELSCTELGAAWELADLGSLPSVFGTPGVGSPDPARLRAQGLINADGGVHPELHRAMLALAHARTEVDLRFTAYRTPVRALAAVVGGVAFLAVVTGDHVRFSRVPAGAALPALVAVLPATPPARGTPVSLPVAEVDAALTRCWEPEAARQDPDRVCATELVRRGVAAADAELFTALAGGNRTLTAEFGVLHRERTVLRRCPGPVQVIDRRPGRAVVWTRGDYLVAEPADAAAVVRALTDRPG